MHDLGDQPACAIIKHANPCGVAVADDISPTAYQRARVRRALRVRRHRRAEPPDRRGHRRAHGRRSAGRRRDRARLRPDAIEALSQKRKNTPVARGAGPDGDRSTCARSRAGSSCRTPHHFAAGARRVAGRHQGAPTEEQWRDAELAWRICGHVKSNAIVLVKDGQAVGIGAGPAEPGRVRRDRGEEGRRAARAARARATRFYPFPDGIEAAAAAGVAVVVQPGGGGRRAVIERADELGLAMVFTGERHFLH